MNNDLKVIIDSAINNMIGAAGLFNFISGGCVTPPINEIRQWGNLKKVAIPAPREPNYHLLNEQCSQCGTKDYAPLEKYLYECTYCKTKVYL